MKALATRIVLDMLFGLYMAVALAVATDAAELANIKVIDGDTFRADIQLGFGVTLPAQDVRVMGFDAWETSYRRKTVNIVPSELVRGQQAKKALEKLLSGAKIVTAIEPTDKDPYGRRLLWVYADGKEIGAILRAQGHERKNP